MTRAASWLRAGWRQDWARKSVDGTTSSMEPIPITSRVVPLATVMAGVVERRRHERGANPSQEGPMVKKPVSMARSACCCCLPECGWSRCWSGMRHGPVSGPCPCPYCEVSGTPGSAQCQGQDERGSPRRSGCNDRGYRRSSWLPPKDLREHHRPDGVHDDVPRDDVASVGWPCVGADVPGEAVSLESMWTLR